MKRTIKIQDLKKGLEIYHTPYIYFLSKDKETFYYSEIGVLVSCNKQGLEYADFETKIETKRSNKFALHIQYDYMSADDVNNFGYIPNTGTYGVDFLCDTLEDAFNKTEEFLASDFVDYRNFYGELIPQKNKLSIREVAEAQSLHHNATFHEYIKKDDLYLIIIKNSGKIELYNNYVERNKNRHKADLKYREKLHNKVKEDFGFDVSTVVHGFNLRISEFLAKAKLTMPEAKEHPKFKTIQKLYNYYNPSILEI